MMYQIQYYMRIRNGSLPGGIRNPFAVAVLMLLSTYLVISGFKGSSSSWTAHGTRSEFHIQFDAIKSIKEGRPVLLTGEMVFSWLFDEIQALKPFKDAAHLLAKKNDWPPLYDISTLKNNK